MFTWFSFSKEIQFDNEPEVTFLTQEGTKNKEKFIMNLQENDPSWTTNFVLVYNKNSLSDINYKKIVTFVNKLEEKGLELKLSPFTLNDDTCFILIHVPEQILLHFAEIFNIDLAYKNVKFNFQKTKSLKFMMNDLTDPDMSSLGFRRPKTQDTEIRSAEKGLIIYKILCATYFGEKKNEQGIQKLINCEAIEAAYPLHDGNYEWTEEGPLNDRQLLARYWSRMKCLCKQQPLDLIEKYFGSEVAFYFGWLGFYNKMLIPASLLSILFIIFGAICFYSDLVSKKKVICKSDKYLCPKCIVSHCKYEPLKNSCLYVYLFYVLDNPLVITFAALMSIWSTVFLELWKREESILQVRWNLRNIETDYSMRPEFEEHTNHYKVSEVSGLVEPYMTKKQKCYRYTITIFVILFLVILLTIGLFGILIYIKTVSVVLTQMDVLYPSLIASFSGSVMSATLILLVDFFYEKIAIWLTEMENPRTQIDFDNSFIYKSYALAFVNNYCVVFYIAFFKARFYTYPGDQTVWTNMGGIGSDLCDAAGCIVDLAIQIVVVLTAKDLASIIKQYIVPKLLILLKKYQKNKLKTNVDASLQWEKDYFLNDVYKYYILDEQMQMVIQYGFVTFFVAAFPAAPLFAFIDNLIELRVDAWKLTTAHKRPVAVKVPNLGAWNDILEAITYFGVATNAFVIAFTSEFIQRFTFLHMLDENMFDYVSSTLSAYNVSEFPLVFENNNNISVCYYPGMRYPPEHLDRYKLADNYWIVQTFKFLTVIIFEHVVMIITGIIAYVIPDVPFSVKEHINFQKERFKEKKEQYLYDSYLKDSRRTKLNVMNEI